MFGQERAALGDLRIVTRVWGSGEAAEYQADLLAPKPGVAGNWAPIVRLNHEDPGTIRAFAQALLAVADETEHQYDTEDR
ncbi:hypothetical protein K1T35_47520 (plasmid) [Pseudonocardia sp. DSM 110487]|uniref:hypothetical protein n=1 Tax=Pseudonocardia sp. DSM 110487 TaxID=2865833 RepID=UPI001C6A0666|nr:hypothetical protein [Pseudonocardia sp. DSM 110487]QYN41000.1 hypothetical protein K1T35_47520 [Pseudonocardia sp. DSM 110487]